MILTILSTLVIGQVPFLPESTPTPQQRRARRERVVARVEGSRQLVEAFEDGAAAVERCSPATGKKLAEFYSSGGMARWPDPAAFLSMVSKTAHPDDPVLWALNHSEKLVDPDNFAAFLDNPDEVSLELTPLERLASAHRARKLSYVTRTGFTPEQTQKVIVYAVIVGGLLALAWWRWKKKNTINSLAPRPS
jgi:hypothetical protein